VILVYRRAGTGFREALIFSALALLQARRRRSLLVPPIWGVLERVAGYGRTAYNPGAIE
jgi:hypothetical protein